MASPYRADHVGSLLRPQELLDARKDPGVTREQVEAVLRHAERSLAVA